MCKYVMARNVNKQVYNDVQTEPESVFIHKKLGGAVDYALTYSGIHHCVHLPPEAGFFIESNPSLL